MDNILSAQHQASVSPQTVTPIDITPKPENVPSHTAFRLQQPVAAAAVAAAATAATPPRTPSSRRRQQQRPGNGRDTQILSYRRIVQTLCWVLMPLVLARILMFAMVKVNLHAQVPALWLFSDTPTSALDALVMGAVGNGDRQPSTLIISERSSSPSLLSVAASHDGHLEAPIPVASDAADAPTDMVIPPSSPHAHDRQSPMSATAHSTIAPSRAPEMPLMFDRIVQILVQDAGYDKDWVLTKATGLALYLLYTFVLSLGLVFSALFHSFGFFYVVVRRWTKMWRFLRSSFHGHSLFETGVM